MPDRAEKKMKSQTQQIFTSREYIFEERGGREREKERDRENK